MEQSLAIIRKPRLTKGQSTLLQLIIEKIDDSKPITFNEAKEIYLSKVCQIMREGVPMYYEHYAHKTVKENGEIEWKGDFIPITDYQLTQYVLHWLVSNIGALVLKGHLKVIPMIEVKQLI